MTTYRYLLADLRTNAILAELPFTGVQFSQSLNAIGTLSATLEITDLTESAMNIMAGTIPGRTAIYVDRNNSLIWGGIIWSRSYSSSSQRISINAREFLSYFEHRVINSDLGYTSVDQLTIAQQLLINAQGAGAGNIGIQVGSETSGVTISKNYYAYELKGVYSALSDLSRSSTGFDYRIDVDYDGSNNPIKVLKLGYPRLGTVYSATNINAPVFEFPAGNVIEYSWPEDGSQVANVLYTSGAGSNEGKLISNQTNTTYQSAGWPILEATANYSDVTDQTLLTNLAAGQLAAVVYPPTTLQIVAPANQNPEVGSFTVGDDVRIRIRDPRFPNGLDQTMRLVSLAVTVGENNQAETQTLTLTLPTS